MPFYTFVLLFSFILHSQSISIQKPRLSASYKGNTVDPPQNYTLQATYQASYKADALTYSPDQNWIVYACLNTNTNVLFYRPRDIPSQSGESSVIIGSPNNSIISSLEFSRDGSLLFVGTRSDKIFVCKFSSYIQESDCAQYYELGNQKNVYSMMANSANKLIVTGNGEMWFLNFTSDGNLAFENYIKFDKVSWIDMMWHPQAETQMAIFGMCNQTSSNQNNQSGGTGQVVVYNITSHDFTTNPTGCVYHINVLKDNLTLLASQGDELTQYTLSLTEATFVGQAMNQSVEIYQTSTYDLIVGWKDEPSEFIMYQIYWQTTKLNRKNNQISSRRINGFHEIYRLKAPIGGVKWFLVSSDLNEILITTNSSTDIQKYALCTDATTYLDNQTCTNCSPVCKTCHISPDTCYNCIDNSYGLKNGTCLKCNKIIDGCLNCTNSTFCFLCDTVAGFIKTPSNGICLCEDFNYVKEGFCVTCDGKSICKKCLSPSYCLTCDKQKKWAEASVNGTCFCQDFYFNSSSVCTLCDPLKMCKTCDNSSYCTKCDPLKGFLENSVNGVCVCPASYTYNQGKCISCLIDGCTSCLVSDLCNECQSGTSLSNGICVKGSNSMIFIFLGVGVGLILIGVIVYCKCKKSKENKLKQSLITSGKGEEETKKGAIQKSEDKSLNSKLVKQKVEVQPKPNEQVIVSKVRKSKDQKKLEIMQSDEDQEEGEPSFIIKYKKLMQKSSVVQKSNLKPRLQKQQNQNEQKPQFSSKLKKQVKKQEKQEFNYDRQVKKNETKLNEKPSKLNEKPKPSKQKQELAKEVAKKVEFDENEEFEGVVQKLKVKPIKKDIKKKENVKLKYQEIPEEINEQEFMEQKPNFMEVKPKGIQSKQKLSKLKKEQSKQKNKNQMQSEQTLQQFKEIQEKSKLKIANQNKPIKKAENQPKQTAVGLNDNEQAAFNQLTDQQKIMLQMARGSFGDA